MSNGQLLDAADAAGFDVLLTTDRNMQHQQTLSDRKIAIVILSKGRWKLIKGRLATIATAIAAAQPGRFTEIDIPSE